MARQLDHTPAGDELPCTVQVMVDDLIARGLQDADCDRVRQAFTTLGPTLDRWPTSKQVIEALPPRQREAFTALPAPGGIPPQMQAMLDMARTRAGAKRKSILLPGETHGDYQRALGKSGMTKADFDAKRFAIPEEPKTDPAQDPYAIEERIAMQQEDKP